MTKKELIREIKDEANRQAARDPKTMYVVDAKTAIKVVKGLDIK